jgi:anthranilate phosphoribosyltransferase
MKIILNRLFEYKTLDRSEAKNILINLAQGSYPMSQVAAFMTVYMMRSITVEELAGFRDAMLELCVPLDFLEYDPMDVCGTGGDGKDTFNISTLSSFVVAGAGQKVCKHGNTGVSSLSGSSNVMEYFGCKFTNDKAKLEKSLATTGICFLHAPLFHPAMKNVAPIRKELGVKTFFNMLGPMVNPAKPNKQLTGVFSLELLRLYAYLYQQSTKNFAIVYALDGYDEISLTGDFRVFSNLGEKTYTVQELGMEVLQANELFGGHTIAENATVFKNVLENTSTKAQKNVVISNAAFALLAANPNKTIADCIATAKESLESGKALQAFKNLLAQNA